MQRPNKNCRRDVSLRSALRRRQRESALASAMEPMERRLLMSHGTPKADIQVSDVNTAGGTALVVNVTYTDNDKIARTSVGASDLVVTNQTTGETLPLANVVAYPLTSDSPVQATY